jgi:hypothetical protein
MSAFQQVDRSRDIAEHLRRKRAEESHAAVRGANIDLMADSTEREDATGYTINDDEFVDMGSVEIPMDDEMWLFAATKGKMSKPLVKLNVANKRTDIMVDGVDPVSVAFYTLFNIMTRGNMICILPRDQ